MPHVQYTGTDGTIVWITGVENLTSAEFTAILDDTLGDMRCQLTDWYGFGDLSCDAYLYVPRPVEHLIKLAELYDLYEEVHEAITYYVRQGLNIVDIRNKLENDRVGSRTYTDMQDYAREVMEYNFRSHEVATFRSIPGDNGHSLSWAYAHIDALVESYTAELENSGDLDIIEASNGEFLLFWS